MPVQKLIGFTIFALAAFALLIGLGVWQLQRLQWKQGLIAEIETRTKAPPTSLSEAVALARKGDDPSYLHVRVAGRFENDKERHLYAIAEGAPGWHLITPLTTDDAPGISNFSATPVRPPANRTWRRRPNRPTLWTSS